MNEIANLHLVIFLETLQKESQVCSKILFLFIKNTTM